MKWSLTNNKSWQQIEQDFTWVADMRGVPQDPFHHAEGDVATHTEMVLTELTRHPDYQNLTDDEKEVVWSAALLHDVEKRSTTIEEDNGRITSRGHAKKGEFTARQILYREIPTPFVIREQIAGLVRHHGLPLWILEKPNPTKSLLETSTRVNMKILALLAKADCLGRFCIDQSELLDRIELFAELCKEQKCWDGPRKFESGLARFTYFNKEDSHPDYIPFDDLKGEVIMLSGLPGMGKDTYIRRHYPHHPVVSLDDIRRKNKLDPDDSSATGWVVQQAKEEAKSFLRKGQPFIWNATNITRQMRSQWIDLFVSYKARVKLVYIETNYREWQTQNKDRDHPVPQAVLLRLLSKLEVPLLYEAHDVQYYVKE
jgi:predicted kinase